MNVAPDECPECGGRLWHGSHDEGHHAARRKGVLRSLRRWLVREVRYRELAEQEAAQGRVLLVWRVAMGEHGHWVREFWSGVSYEAWDGLDQEAFLDFAGRDLRDHVQLTKGFRPHFMHTKCRVIDLRAFGSQAPAGAALSDPQSDPIN